MSKKSRSPRMTRRDFTKIIMTFLGSIMGAIVGLPVIGYLVSPAVKEKELDDWVSVGPLESYEIGVPKSFNFTRTKVNGWEKTSNSYGVFVYRESATKLKVFSNICTHLSCRVTWKEDEDVYYCPCHDARFGIAGDVVSGPPPRPMDEYEFKIEDGNIVIHLV